LLAPSTLNQPLLEPIAARLEEALQACHQKDTEAAFECFTKVLEMVKASGDL
jgi:hypothetical protein